MLSARLMMLASACLLSLYSNLAEGQELQRRTLLADGFATENGKVKVAFFDADSTLRVSVSGSVSANGPKDVMILPAVADRISSLNRDGYMVVIVSNQGGVKTGHVKMEVADAALKFTADSISELNPAAIVHYYDFAEGDGEDRKPGKGMGLRLEKYLNGMGLALDWSQSFMVGDSAYKKKLDKHPDGRPGTHFSNSDRLFAENLKIPFIEPNDFFGWRQYGIDVFENAEQVEEFLKKHPHHGLLPGKCARALAN